MILRKCHQYIVPDAEYIYDNFKHLLSTDAVCNDNLIRYNLEGLSAMYFVCNDECIHHTGFWLNDGSIHWMHSEMHPL